MPTAICITCGKENQWRNQRGVRLADLRCYHKNPDGTRCGGKLRQRTKEEREQDFAEYQEWKRQFHLLQIQIEMFDRWDGTGGQA